MASRKSRRHVRYVGTTDDWRNITFVLGKVGDFAHLEYDNLVSVVGGLSFLNLLTRVEPRELVLYDAAPSALEYAGLFRQLVIAAESRLELMRFIYGRRFDRLEELSVEHQIDALRHIPARDPAVLDLLRRRLDDDEMWHSYTRCLLADQQTMEVYPSWNGRRHMRMEGVRRRLWGVETQTFHLGRGWLKDEATYRRVRAVLERIPLTCLDLQLQDITYLLEMLHEPGSTRHDLVYISNIDEFMKAAYAPMLSAVITAEKRNALVWASRNHVVPIARGLRLDPEPVERRFGNPPFPGISVASPTYLTLSRKGLAAVDPPRTIAPEDGVWLEHLPIEAFDGETIALNWQQDPLGNINVSDVGMRRMADADNPARDPVRVLVVDGQRTLANGYHRIAELKVRGYAGAVAAQVSDRTQGELHWNTRYRRGAFGYLDDEGGRTLFCDVVSIIGDLGGRSVFDVGCWHGNLLSELHDIDHYAGLDLSALAIAAAGRVEKPFRVDLHVGDLRELPVPAEQFDVIYFGGCMGYVKDPVATVAAYAETYGAKHIIWQDAVGFVKVRDFMPDLWMSGLYDLRLFEIRRYPMKKFARRQILVLTVRDPTRVPRPEADGGS